VHQPQSPKNEPNRAHPRWFFSPISVHQHSSVVASCIVPQNARNEILTLSVGLLVSAPKTPGSHCASGWMLYSG
jgi:hypothetical protein